MLQKGSGARCGRALAVGRGAELRCPEGVEPAEFMYARCLPKAATERRTARTLAQDSSLSAHILWVEPETGASPAAWWAFLRSYDEAIRGLPGDPARIVLCLRGATGVSAEPGALSVRRWEGVVEPIDALFFAARLRGSREPSDSDEPPSHRTHRPPLRLRPRRGCPAIAPVVRGPPQPRPSFSAGSERAAVVSGGLPVSFTRPALVGEGDDRCVRR